MGDTLYFWSMTKIGASRALPISGAYPLSTWALATTLLGESITLEAMLGTVLVLAGVYLISPRTEPLSGSDARTDGIGIIAALAAAPLIGVPLSAWFLRERVTAKIAAGTLLSVVGIRMIL